MIPAGRYTAKPNNWMLSESAGGSERFAVEFEITQPGEFCGQQITWDSGFSSDKAVEMTVKALRVMGWQGDDFEHVELSRDPVQVVVEHHEWEGNTYARVKFVNPLSGLSSRKELDPAKRASFAERMRARVALIDQRIGTPTPPPARPKATGSRPATMDDLPPAGPDDDIPF